jgi:putative colanic acid biosynthesis UDP-glucose lipid carrier transferase
MITDTGLIVIPVARPLVPAKTFRYRHYIDAKRPYFTGKRLFDIFLSLLFIVLIVSWLLPILAILIKCSSRGPVFFAQKRVGRGGKTFTCYKLRTMIVNAEANQQQALQNDRRVTAIGHFLRKSNIDEFPQFINVLLGNMSIVGPRPHMHADCYRFAQEVKNYKLRNLVKPGITGLSQVKGYHGRVIDKECILRRYEWDTFYIRNAGFWLDLRIIATTAIQRIQYIFRLK